MEVRERKKLIDSSMEDVEGERENPNGVRTQ